MYHKVSFFQILGKKIYNSILKYGRRNLVNKIGQFSEVRTHIQKIGLIYLKHLLRNHKKYF